MMQVTAAGWYILHQTDSATAVGVLAALTFAPAVVGANVGGWLADKYDAQRLSALLFGLQAIPPIVLGILAWNSDLPIPVLFIGVFLGAIPNALASPVAALVPPLVAPEKLRPQVIAYSSIAYNCGRVVGPVIGAMLVAGLGVGSAFLINGLTYVVVAWAYLTAKLVRKPTQRAGNSELKKYREDVQRGWAFRETRIAFVSSVFFFALVVPIQQLMPTLASDRGEEIGNLGVMLVALALGGVACNPIIVRLIKAGRSHGSLINLGLLIGGPSLMMMGVSTSLAMDMVCLFFIGMAWECLWVASQSSLMLKLPEELTGRIVGLYFSIVTLCIAIGSLLLGMLFDLLGTRAPLIVMGLFVLGYGIAGVVKLRRVRV